MPEIGLVSFFVSSFVRVFRVLEGVRLHQQSLHQMVHRRPHHRQIFNSEITMHTIKLDIFMLKIIVAIDIDHSSDLAKRRCNSEILWGQVQELVDHVTAAAQAVTCFQNSTFPRFASIPKPRNTL